MDVRVLLDDLDDHVKTEFARNPKVEESGHSLDLSSLPVAARRWVRVEEIVAVVADLRHSTSLGTGNQHAASTASIYEAAVYPAVRILVETKADDLAIQGDGVVGIYWGERRFERAFAAGVTIKTFSSKTLVERLERRWPELAEVGTGFKTGIAASSILVKKIGIPRSDHQKEVWAGKAVNFASKAAQAGERNDLIVTGTAWDILSKNDYIAYSCSCNRGPSPRLWEDIEIRNIPTEKDEHLGRRLTTEWCSVHGREFCSAILAGESRREDVSEYLRNKTQTAAQQSLRAIAQRNRERRRSLRGLR